MNITHNNQSFNERFSSLYSVSIFKSRTKSRDASALSNCIMSSLFSRNALYDKGLKQRQKSESPEIHIPHIG